MQQPHVQPRQVVTHYAAVRDPVLHVSQQGERAVHVAQRRERPLLLPRRELPPPGARDRLRPAAVDAVFTYGAGHVGDAPAAAVRAGLRHRDAAGGAGGAAEGEVVLAQRRARRAVLAVLACAKKQSEKSGLCWFEMWSLTESVSAEEAGRRVDARPLPARSKRAVCSAAIKPECDKAPLSAGRVQEIAGRDYFGGLKCMFAHHSFSSWSSGVSS